MTVSKRSIDRWSAVPIHSQLRQFLEDRITSGELGPGDRLPGELFLSEHYQVSRSTVRQALSALQQSGLIRKEKGRGAFVSAIAPRSWLLQSVGGLFYDELSRNGVVISSAVIRSAVEALPDWAAHSLQLASATRGMTLERVRYLNGEASIYVVNHLPEPYADVLPELLSSPTASLYHILSDRHGLSLAGSSRVLEAVPAPGACARHLGVRRGSPVAFIQSISWDATMTPVDCYRAWVRTDRLQISVESQAWESSTGRAISHTFAGVMATSAGHTEGW